MTAERFVRKAGMSRETSDPSRHRCTPIIQRITGADRQGALCSTGYGFCLSSATRTDHVLIGQFLFCSVRSRMISREATHIPVHRNHTSFLALQLGPHAALAVNQGLGSSVEGA